MMIVFTDKLHGVDNIL